MPQLWKDLYYGGTLLGGIGKSYSLDILYEEIAFISYYFHWSRKEIMDLEHKERIRFCEEISNINMKMNGEEKKKNIFDLSNI